MSDKKISELPSASTPLAGTEAVPLVQGGITEQVSVANLTAGRDVSANIFSSAAGAVGTPAITTTGDTNTGIFFPAADTVAVSTAGTERMRIDNAGRVGIGGTAGTDTLFGIYGNARSTSATNFGVRSFVTVPSTNTTRFTAFESNAVTQAASFTLTNYRHFVAAQDSIGAGSSIASQFGFYAENNLTGATNNYGFFSNIASGTGLWNFYAAGTASNFFEGSVGIGTTTTSGKLNVTGGTIEFDPGNGADSTRAFNFNITGTNFGKILIPVGSGGAMAFWTGSPAAERMRIGSTGIISLGAAPGSESLRVTPVASAVNYINVNGGATGNAVGYVASGSDSNISIGATTKGSGVFDFYSNNYGSAQFRIAHTASAVNYLQVTGGATGSAPVISAVGSDTNIDLTLTPKGTGVLRFGTYTAGILAQAGYIQIKDAAGNTRNLLVG